MLESTIQLASATYASKAYYLLNSKGLRCQRVKIEGRRGCTHGISVNYFDQRYALRILNEAEIRVEDVF